MKEKLYIVRLDPQLGNKSRFYVTQMFGAATIEKDIQKAIEELKKNMSQALKEYAQKIDQDEIEIVLEKKCECGEED